MAKHEDFDLQQFLPYLLNIAGEKTSVQFQNYYKAKYGLLRTDWRVLFHIGIYWEITAKEICERAHIHKTKVSRAVARLEERRLIQRESIESDKRFERLKLTTSGQKIYRDLKQAAEEYDQKVLAPLTLEQAQLLKRALMKLAKTEVSVD